MESAAVNAFGYGRRRFLSTRNHRLFFSFISKRLLPFILLAFSAVFVFPEGALPSGAAEGALTAGRGAERGGSVEKQLTFWADLPAEDIADKLIAQMNDDEIISQLFLFGYSGELPSRTILEWIGKRNIGGAKIFGWNAEDLDKLTYSIGVMQQAAAETGNGIPLLIATDQEGGWVRHVKGSTSETPGNLALGASALPYDAYYTGYYIGRELRALGINMNFAPTIDVYTNPDAEVIGPRSFSSDPVETGTLAVAYFRGMEKAGIISTAKHFPGHGNADADSHGTLPIIQDTLDVIWDRDLLPYRFLIKEGLPAIMSGHLAFPKITGEAIPASLSPFFETEVLRNRLGFRGIVITDDLYMFGAHREGYTTGEVCIQAIEAGNDMIMLSRTPAINDEIWQTVSSKYHADESFKGTVRAAVKRVLEVKAHYLRGESAVPLIPDRSQLSENVPDRDGKTFFTEQACRSVAVVRDGKIPYRPAKGEKILIASPLSDFYPEAGKIYPDAGKFPYSLYAYSNDERARLKVLAASADTIIFVLANDYGLELLKSLEPYARKVIVFSVLTPIYLRKTPWVRSALAVFGWSTDTYRAGLSVLRGDYPARGTLPVSIYEER